MALQVLLEAEEGQLEEFSAVFELFTAIFSPFSADLRPFRAISSHFEPSEVHILKEYAALKGRKACAG